MNHLTYLLAFVLTISSPVVASARSFFGKSDAILDVGNRRQVFINGRFFASSKNVELVVHPPRKTGERTLVTDQPWEGHGVGNYSTVMCADGVYHLWYPTRGGLCYARSKDGIKWEKPILGLAEYKGSTNNNIVVGHGAGGIKKCSSEGMVFYDPTAPADQHFRYATRISDELKDTIAFSSPDGIHWRMTHQKVLTFTRPDKRQHLDSQNIIFWDDRIHKYVAYMRRNQFKPGFRGRSVARSESDHLGGFAEVQDAPIVLGPDSQDARLGGKPVVDYYTSGAMKYPYAQDAYFMFPQAYFCYPPGQLAEFPLSGGTPINTGPIDTQFAASRDGIKWQRFDRRPFVSLGMKGEFDSKAARVFSGLVPSVDRRELYLYYVGSDQLHGWSDGKPRERDEEEIREAQKLDPQKQKEQEEERRKQFERGQRNHRLLTAAGLTPTENVSLVSRLVLRRDGFVSARAAYSGGEFTTPPLKFSGRELVLNVDTSATGMLRCELRDNNNRPIKGFALGDCDLIHTANELDRPVKWNGKSDLSAFATQPVRLRVVYRDTDLYAFQFR